MAYKVNNVSILDSSDTQGDFRADFNTIVVGRIERPGNSTTAAASGGGSGYVYQGSSFGYSSGGVPFSTPYTQNSQQTTDRFSFTSDGNATDHADLAASAAGGGGCQSTTNAYIAGGYSPWTNMIHKFPFSATAIVSGTDTGANVGQNQIRMGGNNSETNGYFTGGQSGTHRHIYKFNFATEAYSGDIGQLTRATWEVSSSSSTTHGYSAGGEPYPLGKIIDKFSFSSDGDATSVGNLAQFVRYIGGGSSSTTHGYAVGGNFYSNYIQKYPFASDTDGSDIANLVYGISLSAGHSSTTHGYASGSWPYNRNYIQKYPYASDTDGTDIGDLTVNRGDPTGNHN